MATKRQQEIREWCLSNLEAGEKLLWYGEGKASDWQRVSTQLSKFLGSINSIFKLINKLAQMSCAGIFSLFFFCLAIVSLGAGLLLLKIMPLLGIVFVISSLVFFWLSFFVFPIIIHSLQKKSWENYNPMQSESSEPVQTVAYAVTNYRILCFDQKPYGEFPLELLEEAILSKPKDGLSNISLYPISKSKNPQPSYVLRAVPEEEAQNAYLILREARDYAERVRDRDAALEKRARGMGIE